MEWTWILLIMIIVFGFALFKKVETLGTTNTELKNHYLEQSEIKFKKIEASLDELCSCTNQIAIIIEKFYNLKQEDPLMQIEQEENPTTMYDIHNELSNIQDELVQIREILTLTNLKT